MKEVTKLYLRLIKAKKTISRRWTSKMVFFLWQKAWFCELILALVSLWLLVNSIKKENPEGKCPFNLFLIILFKDIFYIILLFYLFFGFKRGYGVKNWLDFILTEIKRYYNSNDRWKFILFFIRWENDLNKWLKHVKRGTKNKWNKNKSMRNKWGSLRAHRMNWKVRFWELTD